MRRSNALDRTALGMLQEPLERVALQVQLWDGTSLYKSAVPPIATIAIGDRPMLFQLVRHRELKFGEGYTAGRVEVLGDLIAALEGIYRTFPPQAATWFSRLSTWRRNTIDRARHDIHRHYDRGNDFYRLWLDEKMLYTCAYYPTPDATLEQAQIAKMDLVCRKLHLQPGERVVETGCGWGALALHMARHYGVLVTSYNISHEQIAYARQQAEEQGLADRVRFVEDDYRTIADRHDAFVSIGMLEHVGLAQFRVLGQVIDRALDQRRGRGLLHFISRDFVYPLSPWIRKRIFPGAYPPTLTQVTERILEPSGLSVLDVQNLRQHYARTLKAWLDRFDSNADRVALMFDDDFSRAWRLYLAGSQAAFTTGWMQLQQVVFARRGVELARVR